MEKLKQIYEGKAKKLFETKDPGLLIQEFKDDATAFDATKRGTIVNKGVINNKLSEKIFGLLERKGIPTHFVKRLNDRDMLVKRVKIVPTVMPVTSTIPMLLRAAAPGPVARTSGRCPKTVAAEVISTGRSRVNEASRIAIARECPRVWS